MVNPFQLTQYPKEFGRFKLLSPFHQVAHYWEPTSNPEEMLSLCKKVHWIYDLHYIEGRKVCVICQRKMDILLSR